MSRAFKIRIRIESQSSRFKGFLVFICIQRDRCVNSNLNVIQKQSDGGRVRTVELRIHPPIRIIGRFSILARFSIPSQSRIYEIE